MEAFRSSKGKAYAKYGHFYVSGPEDKYRLSIDNYSGTAGHDMSYHNGMRFTTVDNDNEQSGINCAVDRKGGWWYNSCNSPNPNGIMYSTETSSEKSMYWYAFHSTNSLKFMEMKIRNKNSALCGI